MSGQVAVPRLPAPAQEVTEWLGQVTAQQAASPQGLELLRSALTLDAHPCPGTGAFAVRWQAVASNAELGPGWVLDHGPWLESWAPAGGADREHALVMVPLVATTLACEPERTGQGCVGFIRWSPRLTGCSYQQRRSALPWQRLAVTISARLDELWAQASAVPANNDARSDEDLGLVRTRRVWSELMASVVEIPEPKSTSMLMLLHSQWAKRWPELTSVWAVRHCGMPLHVARWLDRRLGRARSAGTVAVQQLALKSVDDTATMGRVADLMIDMLRPAPAVSVPSRGSWGGAAPAPAVSR